MAVFDRDNGKIVIRVVYDGPGNAGKTTNLVEMCQYFTARRRSELVSPEVREGRTMWFDWLQIDAGLVAGYGLRCQIVTVPGQVVLQRRRTALLSAADVVVLVCDSTPGGLELVRPAYGRIRQFVAEHAGAQVPIVLQANKQDLPDAVPPEEIAARLGADASIPIVAARANASIGVKETLVLAIRAAANRAQELLLERGVDALAGKPDDAASVLRELQQLGDTRGEVLDELLAQPTFVEDRRPEVVAEPAKPVVVAVAAAPSKPVAVAVAAEPPTPVAAAVAAEPSKPVAAAPSKPVAAAPSKPMAAAPSKPVAAAPSKPVAAAVVAAVVARDPSRPVPVAVVAEPSRPMPRAVVAEPSRPMPRAVAAEPSRPVVVSVEEQPSGRVPLIPPPPPILPDAIDDAWTTTKEASAPISVRPDWWPEAPLGEIALAPGSLWPASTGRDVLRALATAVPRPRLDLVAQRGDSDGSGKASTVIYEAGGWCLKTSTGRRFPELDAARAALVKLARTKISLGTLTLHSTVLVIHGDATSGYWVWTIAPWRKTLRSAMTEAIAARDGAALGSVLVNFTRAVAEALVRAIRAGQGLDLHPSNFAIDGDTLVYIDDEISPSPPLLGAAHAILQRAEELTAFPDEIDRYARTLLHELSLRLTSDDLGRLRLLDELRTTATRAPLARALRDQLLATLGTLKPATPSLTARGSEPVSVAPAAPAAAAGSGAVRTPDVAPAAPVAPVRSPRVAAPPAPPAEAVATPEPAAPAEPVRAPKIADPEPARAPEVAAAAPVAEPVRAPDVPPTEPAPAAAAPEAGAWPMPQLNADGLPSGFIWPVVAGRELMRRLVVHSVVRCDHRPYTYALGDYTLTTSTDRRFGDVDDGRVALLRLARALVAGGGAPANTVLVLAPDEAGGHWIWTIAPTASDACASP